MEWLKICQSLLCEYIVLNISKLFNSELRPFVLDQNAFRVGEKFSRLPFKMDYPEKILCQAHGQSRPITDFLHENGNFFLSSICLCYE